MHMMIATLMSIGACIVVLVGLSSVIHDLLIGTTTQTRPPADSPDIHLDQPLDQALDASFPASDPPSIGRCS
jgi:hypothetical protein